MALGTLCEAVGPRAARPLLTRLEARLASTTCTFSCERAHRDLGWRPRIGVEYAGPWARRLLRFYVSGNRFVSRR